MSGVHYRAHVGLKVRNEPHYGFIARVCDVRRLLRHYDELRREKSNQRRDRV